MKTLISLCLLFVMTNVYANTKAQVIVMRGKVTKLEPRANEAKTVKKGDWLLEDTSIVTAKKSFVKIRFEDGSLMNLGPDSMVVINKMPKKKSNVVNLLTGLIKAEVKKNKKAKTKMLIRTRSAVMGVRGTKFQTSYNHANKRTTLVTVEGEVAMSKKIQNLNTKADKASAKKQEVELDELEEIFEKESTNIVEVKAGEFSGVAESIKEPTKPVRIAPEQYNALAKSLGSEKTANDVMGESNSAQDAEALFDKTNSKIKPRAGGYIDFNSGLYVEPLKTAKFDAKTGTFQAEKIGTIDKKTASYIPPKGVVIDEKKGFVLKDKNLNDSEMQKTLLAMNEGIKEQVTTVNQIKNDNLKEKESKITEDSESWFKNHKLKVSFMPYSEDIQLENKKADFEKEYRSKNANWFLITWQQYWSDDWQTFLTLGNQDYELSNDDEVRVYDDRGDEGDGYFSLGVIRTFKNSLIFSLAFTKRNEVVVYPDEFEGTVKENTEIDYLDLSLFYKFSNGHKWSHAAGGLIYLPTESEEANEAEILGLGVETHSHYRFSKHMSMFGDLVYRRVSILTERDNIEITKQETGIRLGLQYQF